MVEVDSVEDDGGIAEVESFVKSDPYVKNNLVKDWNIKEFALKGAITDFDRLAQKFVLRS